MGEGTEILRSTTEFMIEWMNHKYKLVQLQKGHLAR